MRFLNAVPFLSRAAAAALALAVCAPATPLFAQTPSLAELAKKEQERRKAVKTEGKVYSNKDLPASAAPAGAAAALPPATPAPADAKPAEPAKVDEQKTEEWWRTRMAQAREALRRSEVFAEALQTRINALSNDASNRDDPYQRVKIGEERQKAVAELARVTAEGAQAKKEIADIEEEARQGGVPPGWIR
jgi:hypothetical protein